MCRDSLIVPAALAVSLDERRMLMTALEIKDTLVNQGLLLFNKPRDTVPFTGEHEADVLLNDITRFPHAFVLGCIMDRQMPAEKAWLIPFLISNKLGGFSIERLRLLSLNETKCLMSHPQPLHRFPDLMGGNFYYAVQRFVNLYDSDASNIWRNNPASAEVVCRFLEFDGVGQKIASMATNILARELKVPFSDFYSVDISVDTHVRRVFRRLSLVSEDASNEFIVWKARALHPEFPGLMDFPCWEIGRMWCKPKAKNRNCHDCYMQECCPSAL